jgi:tetratricopeptide (TPR) repeat protein
MSQSLHDIWASQRAALSSDAKGAFRLAKKANGMGEYLLAIEITEEALNGSPNSESIPLLQQKALALARSGSTYRALEILGKLREQGCDDSETLGMHGRVFKDLAGASSESADRKRFLIESQQLYQLGFDRDRSTYCGINAAAVAVLLGETDLAKRLAEQVLEEKGEDDKYYNLATRAEAVLILGDHAKAAGLYREACMEVQNRWADVAGTRKQCRALALKVYGRQDKFDVCFPAGAVAVFAGHLADASDRATSRFPAEAEESVRKRIEEWLTANSIRWSFSAAACGSDLIFLDAARQAGVETHILLPFREEEFIRWSVRSGGEHWVDRFHEALAHAASKTILNEEVVEDPSSAFDFTNRIIAARAALQATTMDVPLKGLAVWDGKPGDGRGGTADAAACWCRAKIDAQSIHPTQPERDAAIREEETITVTPFDRTTTAMPIGCRTDFCSILHLYFASYSDLRDSQYYRFQETILGALAKVLATTSHAPVGRYGLGPDYVFVFDAMRPGGMLAIQIIQALEQAVQAPSARPLDMPRICLHAGLVQLMVNPVLNQYSHEGATLTRVGRIARKLAPGVAFCTESFAALSALESIREFTFEYVGTPQVAEGEPRDRLFSIRYK